MDQDKIDEFSKQLSERFEAESLESYGPPEIREQKNRAYIKNLTTQYSEQVIRGILQALSKEETPMCVTFLKGYDLKSEPLEGMIRQFEFGGFNFTINAFQDDLYTVETSISFWMEGDSGTFIVTQTGGEFRVIENQGGVIF